MPSVSSGSSVRYPAMRLATERGGVGYRHRGVSQALSMRVDNPSGLARVLGTAMAAVIYSELA